MHKPLCKMDSVNDLIINCNRLANFKSYIGKATNCHESSHEYRSCKSFHFCYIVDRNIILFYIRIPLETGYDQIIHQIRHTYTITQVLSKITLMRDLSDLYLACRFKPTLYRIARDNNFGSPFL